MAPTIASEADNHLGEVFNVMGEMRTYPVADIPEEFLEDNLMRLDSLGNDMKTCLRQLMIWEERYEDEMYSTLKQKEDGKVSTMEADFKAYKA